MVASVSVRRLSALARVGMRTSCVAGAVVLVIVCVAAVEGRQFDGKTWWQHVEVLAADAMGGRAVGSTGIKRAQAYVVAALEKHGITPAGPSGYYQPIRVVVREVVAKDSSVALVRDGKAVPLILGEDAVFTPSVELPSSVEAPLVFIGYGLRIPERNHDDFAGLDLKGKVAVSLAWPPVGVTGSVATHHLSEPRRWEQLQAAGAIGWIRFAFPTANWSFISDALGGPTSATAAAESGLSERQQLAMLFNPARADRLFEGSGHTAQELWEAARTGKPLPRFELPVRIRAAVRTRTTTIACANLLATLAGSDPALKNEYVVISAHIDGQGIGNPVNGDRIYNGAIDNASGVAVLLDLAAQLRKERPRRSVLFAFFTAEEGALLGSKYFLEHPTVDRKAIVANLNIDNVQVTVPLQAVEVLAMDDSDLGAAVRRVVAAQGLSLDLDSRLGNSDHLRFIEHGIPAVKVNVGFLGDLVAVQDEWRKERYHTPFDDLQQPVHLEAARKYEEFVRALLLDVGNNPQRPAWKIAGFDRP